MRTLYGFLLVGVCSLAGCFPGGGGGAGDALPSSETPSAPPPTANETLTDQDAVRFVQQATFGASATELEDLKADGLNAWVIDQLNQPISAYTPRLQNERLFGSVNSDDLQALFWERAIHGQDQLRQRMAFALSQIVVVSMRDGAVNRHPLTFGTYADLLQEHALGNYCQLIRDVSFNPTMGMFLTHLGNRKAKPESGFVPDENYARELMQLFTIGLEELDAQGQPQGQETYTDDDVEGLAAVFTGLSWADTDFDFPRVTDNNRWLPMESFLAQHEDGPKSFLGTTVDVGNDAVFSVDAALDAVLSHPNVAPFISTQLIQKLVTSNPSPSYVGRVAAAFEAGQFQLSNGQSVGSGQRCDLGATAAAILLDKEARTEPTDPNAGKIRSPLLQLAQLIRTFRLPQELTVDPERIPSMESLRRLEDSSEIGMNAFYSPSVFNSYRPGYVGPGTESAAEGLLTPEFQLATTPTLVGYINEVEDVVDGFNTEAGRRYIPILLLDSLEALAQDPEALTTEVDRLLTGGSLSESDRSEVIAILQTLNVRDKNLERDLGRRAQLALVLIATSPDYLVQQ